jgi:hypothetical protein
VVVRNKMSVFKDPWRMVCPECKICTYRVYPNGEYRYTCKNGHKFDELYDMKLEEQRDPQMIQ